MSLDGHNDPICMYSNVISKLAAIIGVHHAAPVFFVLLPLIAYYRVICDDTG